MLCLPIVQEDQTGLLYCMRGFQLAGDCESTVGDNQNQHDDPIYHRGLSGVQSGAVELRGDTRVAAVLRCNGPDSVDRCDHDDAGVAVSRGLHGPGEHVTAAAAL